MGRLDCDAYQREAMRTSGDVEGAERLVCAAVGLGGEAGEVLELVKKWRWHDHPLDRDALVKELGDVLWYLALACDAAGLRLSEVAARNIAKLRARYPDGFDADRSREREGE